VQVQLALNAPVARAQAARDLHPDAGAAKAELVVGVEQAAHVKVVADGFHQHPFFVQPVLQRQGLGRGGGQFCQIAVGQRMHLPHGAAEQLALCLQPRSASRRAFSSASARSRCSRNWR
jgi:hypothetical protein